MIFFSYNVVGKDRAKKSRGKDMTFNFADVKWTVNDDVVVVIQPDVIFNPRDSIVDTLAGDDTISGTGNSFAISNAGTINTGKGNDSILGLSGEQVSIVNEGTINTGAGNDLISGRGRAGISNSNIIKTGVGDDTIIGIGSSRVGLGNLGWIETGKGNDAITGKGGAGGIANQRTIDTGDGNDSIVASSSNFEPEAVGLENDSTGTILTARGNDSISVTSDGLGTAIVNNGKIDTATGNDSISGRGYIGIVNKGTIDTGKGDDIITATGIGIGQPFPSLNSVGLVNDGTIDLGAGDDILSASTDTTGGLDFTGSGKVFFGVGNDTLSGFGTGEFDGGCGYDTLSLGVGTYSFGCANGFTTIERDGFTMSVKNFEILTIGSNNYCFTDLPATIVI
jgi:hypothetical protein